MKVSSFSRFSQILRKVIIGFVMSIRLAAWYIPAPNGRIFMKFYICVFFENLSRKLNLY